MAKHKMVKISPKIAKALLREATRRGTNVNRLTNQVMGGFLRVQKRKALSQLSNTMPQGVQQ